MEINVCVEYRPCLVAGRKALFHRWADRAELRIASALGAPGGQLCQLFGIVEHLDKMPTTEAEPVVYAHWEKSEYRGFVRCSACKDAYIDEDWLTSWKWSGCPNCRAKMELKLTALDNSGICSPVESEGKTNG